MKEAYSRILPLPNSKSIFFSNLLKKKIINKIQISEKKEISFFNYVNYILYDKKYGYYNNNLKKFGKDGDFTTAPQISSVFGKCIAFRISKITDKYFSILEIGAGTGKLAIDIIKELFNLNINIKKYYILELSSFLRMEQTRNILSEGKKVFDKVEWILDFPKEFEGVILANELLDALPFNLIQMKKNVFYEMHVTSKNDQFYLKRSLMKNNKLKQIMLANIPENILSYDSFYQTEVNMLLEPFLNSVFHCLKKGYILFFDYGFLKSELYHEERNMGTFMCHYRHFKHSNPFFFPGLQDITSHVDFSYIKNETIKKGLVVSGYGNQSDFLISSNLNKIMLHESKKRKNIFKLNQEIFSLTSPNEMGSLFKVIEIKK